jgi:cytochrome P450
MDGTLQHRTAFADENQRVGRCASERAGRLWLIDPHAASELLKEYDGGTGHIVKDDTKRTGLLKSSLTQSDGPDWRRQRAAVVAAVGGGQVAQFTRHRAAACRAGELAASVIADHTARSPQRVMVHPDVMDLARMVAARGIVAAVVGDGDGDANAAAEAARIEVVLSAFMKANRRRKEQKDEAVVQSLGSELQRGILALLEHHSKHESSTSSAATALLARLMSRPELSKEEVIGNANSCLLAGVETTSLLIGCSLLRLACRPALRIAARAEIRASSSSGDATQRSKLVGAIMRETLRVHPPVMVQWDSSCCARCLRDC